jgi:hypothetical protein
MAAMGLLRPPARVPRGRIRFDEDLVGHSREHVEIYAKMGDRLGTATRGT